LVVGSACSYVSLKQGASNKYFFYSEDVHHSNFTFVALHILNATPYIITTAPFCSAYNKWGRPNPPYVIFKHENKGWKRIGLAELPAEFKKEQNGVRS